MTTKLFSTMLSFIMVTVGMQLIIAASLGAQDAPKQKPIIKIDEIVEDEYINGKVANLDSPENYKVLIYVHTDKWYIHPYADQDEDGSWAGISEDGAWSIPTVKRKAKANKIAALVVDPSVAEDAPSQLGNLGKIKKHAIIVYTKKEMKEKGWYGKL